ncbi:hypothetical protein PanWU01x14_032970 [Parasponia andersonii]|uniref:Uncharacterized protein n=1 Tax=Parasponia andersonii TaxID=3476 RepID=A0A2P5DTI9_PARAD|nr:hypothetical protein PanWU01x14_032970 [Parasponia andersonii]
MSAQPETMSSLLQQQVSDSSWFEHLSSFAVLWSAIHRYVSPLYST